MADENSFTLDAASWVDAKEWRRATTSRKTRYLKRVGELAIAAKRKELRLGIGVDGSKLEPVLRRSRPDGATGAPLDPHYGQSRSYRWLRASAGAKGGTVTIWWSHGFGKILGYHARGVVIGAPLRNVIGLTKSSLLALQREARRLWKSSERRRPTGTSQQAPPVTPLQPRVWPSLPAAARSFVRRAWDWLTGNPES